MEIERTDVPATVLAVVREQVAMTGLAEFYDRAFGAVGAALAAAGVAPQGPAYGWYAGMPTGSVDVAAGFPVPPGTVLPDGVELLGLPAVSAVVGTYVGPYDGLPQAWQALERWRAVEGVVPRGDFWEEYLTDPDPDGDPSANVTRLVLPLR